MEQNADIMNILHLVSAPGFLVQNYRIQQSNRYAAQLELTEGCDIRNLLVNGAQEYADLQSGILSLTMSVQGRSYSAYVSRTETADIFLLEAEPEETELKALSLAAQKLRDPLSKMKLSLDAASESIPSDSWDSIQSLRRDLAQLNRLVNNMSDAGMHYGTRNQTLIHADSFFRELFDKAAAYIQNTGIQVIYEGMQPDIACMADCQELERAVLNALSNAVKFTAKGGQILASLTRKGKFLYLQIQDNGSGIPEDVRGTVFSRFLRQPDLEDSRYGIGLGMVLIRKAAAHHGGTVLIDQPEDGGTRITMTLAIRQTAGNVLRSPAIRVDYAGEQDHCLIEFSEILPASLYAKD